MINAFWFDNGETIVVRDNGEECCYSPEEFAEMYGEDALPQKPGEFDEEEFCEEEPDEEKPDKEDHAPTDIDLYYDTLVNFLNSVGSYLHLKKLGVNADEGIFPAQKVVREYGHEGAQFDIELDARKCRYLNYLRKLSDVGDKIGFSPIDEASKRTILSFVANRDRRRYIRDSARVAQKRCDLVSISGLIRRRLELENSK
ncbi:hypothetical protein J6S55_01215 [Candidatus Saccharibacteria bacterium]|nr:hypothetical protein [Candidatus Saccharibacteria bacterium]